MTTVDNLLTKIINHGFDKFSNFIEKKDLKVLKSLGTSVCLPSFITENQSRLLHKILSTYKLHFKDVDSDIEEILEKNSWSKTFRVVENVRKLYLEKTSSGEMVISVEFTHNTRIRDLLNKMALQDFGQIPKISNKVIWYTLTESHIVHLVEALKPHKFEIDQKITNFYEIIKKYEISEVKANYTLEENLPDNMKNCLEEECGPIDQISESILQDRSTRYQYFLKNSPKKYGNLSDFIINRDKPKVWINKNLHPLSEIFKILKEIDRLPTLVVFDATSDDAYLKNLEIFQESLEKSEISENIGIYFRLENTEKGKIFNESIKQLQYNSPLTKDTNIAAVQIGKLPKFFLKDCDWSPKSVIVLDSTLRHNKTAVYSNRCDLVISYSDKESIIEAKTNLWRQ